jgi:hypothetical protein
VERRQRDRPPARPPALPAAAGPSPRDSTALTCGTRGRWWPMTSKCSRWRSCRSSSQAAGLCQHWRTPSWRSFPLTSCSIASGSPCGRNRFQLRLAPVTWAPLTASNSRGIHGALPGQPEERAGGSNAGGQRGQLRAGAARRRECPRRHHAHHRQHPAWLSSTSHPPGSSVRRWLQIKAELTTAARSRGRRSGAHRALRHRPEEYDTLTRKLGPRWARGSEPWPERWRGCGMALNCRAGTG